MKEIDCPECSGSGCRFTYRYEYDREGKLKQILDFVTCVQCRGTGKIQIFEGSNENE